jgi:hypothetical protein
VNKKTPGDQNGSKLGEKLRANKTSGGGVHSNTKTAWQDRQNPKNETNTNKAPAGHEMRKRKTILSEIKKKNYNDQT